MYYTQNNEEQIILDYFSKHNGTLTVLDIGANDGKTFSNSLRVIEEGWNAVLVEPSPKAFAKLKELHGNNSNVICVQSAITNVNGTFELQESSTLLNQGDVSLVSSIKVEETERWRNANVLFSPVFVMGLDFKTFMVAIDQYKFDLISIDVEGFDYDVLSQINLTEVGCKMLIVEFNGKEKEKFVDYCSKYSMKLISENPENLIFTL